MVELDEKTTVPFWAVIVSVPTIVLAVFWLASVSGRVDAHAQDILDLKNDKQEILKKLDKIKETVDNINGRLRGK